MKHLRTIWNDLASNYSDDKKQVDTYWTEIEERYTSKKRHYHNLAHLSYMIEKILPLKERLKDLDTLLFAIFYHDIIYNASRKDNEEKSAAVAQERLSKLGLTEDQISKCQEQILATKAHVANEDSDTHYLLDADLAILGDTPEVYQNYAKQIRAEYSIYPGFLYKKGRRKVLQFFLAKDRIFKTTAFCELYEQQARLNLKAELETLT